MKNLKIFIGCVLLTALLASFTGCSIFGKGKAASQEAAARSKIQNVENQIGANVKDKLEMISSLSYGVDYALGKENAPSTNVVVAKDLNSRTLSLAGMPTLEEINKMKQMIEDLTSQVKTEKERGAQALASKDEAIQALQDESKILVQAERNEVIKYMQLAQNTAAKADATQAKLDDLQSTVNKWWGLGAVVYGLKRLAIRLAWALGIGSVLFLVLRVASMSNPIAASVFSIVDTIMSWFVHAIALIAPKALSVAGQTATAVAAKYKTVMTKMIDNIQALKDQQKSDPNKKFTLDEILTEFSKSLDGDEKAMVTQIKQDLGYK